MTSATLIAPVGGSPSSDESDRVHESPIGSMSVAASAGTSRGCSAAGAIGCTSSRVTRGWMTP
jgi:hypothetical protein